MFPLEMKIAIHEDASGEDPDAPIHTAIVQLQDTPYGDKWAAYAETEASQQARGGLQMYEVWIPHPTWPEIATIN